MGGFFGVASKNDCVFDLFLELIIIHILEQEEVEWLYMARMDLIVQSII